MTPFPWTSETTEQLFRGFSGNTSFKVLWPWAPFHTPGFTALKWAAQKKMTAPQFYEILDQLSCPSTPKNLGFRLQNRLRKARLIDHVARILPLDPSLAIKKTFAMADENLESFADDSVMLLTIEDLLSKNPEIENIWKPIFTEGQAIISRWLLRDQTLLKSFHDSTSWNQLKVIEGLIGVTKPSSILNFERIY
jgi:hypothetical protein